MSEELMKLLGAETVEEIKQGLKQIILDKFKDDIEFEARLWISCEDVQMMIEDAINELKDEYEEDLKEAIKAKVEDFIK